MGSFIDLTNKKFNRLLVLEKLYKKGNEWYWKCQCDCGNICEVAGVNLRRGRVKSCGCLKKESDKKPKGNVINLLNKKFGHLTVIARDGSDNRKEAKWLCECDCENHTIISVLSSNLRNGHTTSCGCERRSHGELLIEKILKEEKIPFIIEYKFDDLPKYRFDFFLPTFNYLIEYDGETHFNYNLHGWHTKDQLLLQQQRDEIKNNFCFKNNIPLIRIPYTHLKELCIEDLKLETTKYLVRENKNG